MYPKRVVTENAPIEHNMNIVILFILVPMHRLKHDDADRLCSILLSKKTN